MKMNEELIHNKSIKYNIDNYYVGEIEIDLGDISINNNYIKRKPKNVAINVVDNFYNKENIFLTLFYLENKKLICLHNAEVYDISKVQHLTSLKQFLSKVDFTLPSLINFKEALIIFRYLFDIDFNYSFEQLYENINHSIDHFYVGKFYFCEKYVKYIDNNIIDYTQDMLYKYLLMKSSARIRNIYEYKENNIYCNYLIYDCLFYKHKNGLLNLNDNKFYNDNQSLNNHLNFGENSYKISVPLDLFLQEHNYNYTKKDISVRKSLNLFKRYNK